MYAIVSAVSPGVKLQSVDPLPARSDRAAVSASQRLRLLRAMTAVVARKGYAGAVVADVVAEARVSRKTFYEQFADLHDCFLAAYDACIDVLRERLLVARDPELPAGARLRQVIDAYLALMDDEPAIARTCLVESYAAGDETAERRMRTSREFAALLAEAHHEMLEHGASGAPLDPVDYEIIVGSVIAAVTSRVHTRDPQPLTELAAALERHVLRSLGVVPS